MCEKNGEQRDITCRLCRMQELTEQGQNFKFMGSITTSTTRHTPIQAGRHHDLKLLVRIQELNVLYCFMLTENETVGLKMYKYHVPGVFAPAVITNFTLE